MQPEWTMQELCAQPIRRTRPSERPATDTSYDTIDTHFRPFHHFHREFTTEGICGTAEEADRCERALSQDVGNR